MIFLDITLNKERNAFFFKKRLVGELLRTFLGRIY